MRFAVRSLCLALLPLAAACNGDDGSSPTGPSNTPPAATRIINVSGNLAFGDVLVGGQRDLSYTITNSGNATLTITGTTVTGGLDAHTIASWTNGQIAAGASQTVTVRFQPTATGSYSGTISVNGDQTSGSNTLAISGAAPAPAVAGTWSGQYRVERCDGTGSVQDAFCSARGAFPPGTTLPIALSLTQNGTTVSGTMALGGSHGRRQRDRERGRHARDPGHGHERRFYGGVVVVGVDGDGDVDGGNVYLQRQHQGVSRRGGRRVAAERHDPAVTSWASARAAGRAAPRTEGVKNATRAWSANRRAGTV